MKTKRLLLAVACLVILAGRGYTQTIIMRTVTEDAAVHMYGIDLTATEAQMRHSVRAFWNGELTGIVADRMLRHPEVRAALGVSDEQFHQIEMGYDVRDLLNDPEMQAAQAARRELTEIDGISVSEFGDEETRNKALVLHERVQEVMMNFISRYYENALTPELIQKIQEAKLATMEEFPITFPGMFEVLNLNEAQRQEMEQIKKELEPEFEKILEEYVQDQMVLERMFWEFVQNQEVLDSELWHEGSSTPDTNAITRRLLTESPEYRRISDEIQSRSSAFSMQFRTRMFDVLTDEQWTRLQDLIDNPPLHARLFIQQLREQRGETEKNEGNIWVPGPGSWRPGDPLPESYRIRRNTQIRFPRPANQ